MSRWPLIAVPADGAQSCDRHNAVMRYTLVLLLTTCIGSSIVFGQSALPVPDPAFKGNAGPRVRDADPPEFPQPPHPPANAPNVVVIMLDDVGFGQFSVFGGEVPSPAMEKLASEGLRYNRFHTAGDLLLRLAQRSSPAAILTMQALASWASWPRATKATLAPYLAAPRRSSKCSANMATPPQCSAKITTHLTGKAARPVRSITGRRAWASIISMDSTAGERVNGNRRSMRIRDRCHPAPSATITSMQIWRTGRSRGYVRLKLRIRPSPSSST